MKILLIAILALLLHDVQAQTIINRDPEIENMVKEVNADSLQSYIKTMVAFKTRSTVSSTTDSKTGIGAARNWVCARRESYLSAPCPTPLQHPPRPS